MKQRDNSPTGRSSPRKSSARQKPSLDEFRIALQAATKVAGARAITKALAILQRGCAAEPEPEPVKAIVDILSAWQEVVQLAVRLSVTSRYGKLARFGKRVLISLRSAFSEAVGYPLATPDGLARDEFLCQWIEAQASTQTKAAASEPKPADSSEPAPEVDPSSWFQMTFVCVLGEQNNHIVHKTLWCLLTQRCAVELKPRQRRFQADREFTDLVVSVLSRPSASLLRRARLLLKLKEDTQATERKLWERVENATARAEASEDRERATSAELKEALTRIEDARVSLGEKDVELAKERERYQALDEHWQGASRAKLARFVTQVKSELGHEVTEALLSLERDEPNVAMALTRIKRMQQLIAGLNGE